MRCGMLSYLLRNGKLLFLLFGTSFLCVDVCGADTDPGLKFVENKNQWPADVHFAARIPGGSMILSPGKFSYHFLDGKQLTELHEHAHGADLKADGANEGYIKGHSIEAEFIGANLKARPIPFGKSAEYNNFYIGNDPSGWGVQAFGYEGVFYPSFYKDIDLKIYSSGTFAKYDFIVAPYADPDQILVSYAGAETLSLENGNLYLKTPIAEIIEKRPVAFQYIDGEKILIECEYHLEEGRLSFCFPKGYDPCYELVIDP
jgi:hypothetical protein